MAAGGGTKSAAISAPHMPAGALEGGDRDWPSVSWLKWRKENRLGATDGAQNDTSGTRGGTVPGTVPGVVAKVTRKATLEVIAKAVLNAIWGVILRCNPKSIAGAISRPAASAVCGAFLDVVCGPTREGTLTPISVVVSSAVVRAFCAARPKVLAVAAVKAGSRTEVRLP